jgi:hypothetical protein
MWLFTPKGFYSVVVHRDDPNRLLVRARTREDLEALREQIPDLELVEDEHADYHWRTIVDRMQWFGALVRIAEDIDYDNFKDAVRREQGPERAALYGRVWSELRTLQRSE